jgi:hypothetical protein
MTIISAKRVAKRFRDEFTNSCLSVNGHTTSWMTCKEVHEVIEEGENKSLCMINTGDSINEWHA